MLALLMAEMWNSVADSWDRHAEVMEEMLSGATGELFDAAGIGDGDAVLDLAAGTGGAGILAAGRVGDTGRVVLADIAPAMVRIAARRSAELPAVTTQVCDELAVDAPDASFDAVICRHGLMFVHAPADAVREARRVLRPEGRYATMTWAARAENPWLGIVLDAVGAQFGVEFPPPNVAGPFSLDDPEQLAAVLRDGGLEDVRVTRVPTPMRAPSIEAWWARVPELAGPVALALAGMEAEVRDAIARRALDAGKAAARSTGAGIEMDGSVLIGSGAAS